MIGVFETSALIRLFLPDGPTRRAAFMERLRLTVTTLMTMVT